MVQTIESKGQLTAIVTDFFDDYVDGLKEVEKLVQKHNNLRPVDLPTAVKLLVRYPEIKEAITGNLNTTTSHILGPKYEPYQNGSATPEFSEPSYKIVHGAFPSITRKKIKDSQRDIAQRLGADNLESYVNDVCYVSARTWTSLGSNEEFLENTFLPFIKNIPPSFIGVLENAPGFLIEEYFPKKIPGFYVNDLKKGNVPGNGTPYVISTYDGKKPGPTDCLAMLLGGYDNAQPHYEMTPRLNGNGVENLILADNLFHVTDIGKGGNSPIKLPSPIGQGVYLDVRNGLIGGGFPPGQFLLLRNEAPERQNHKEFSDYGMSFLN